MSSTLLTVDRRDFIRTGAAALVLVEVAGCGRAAAPSKPQPMLVYRDPSCGCCEAWADLARQHGFAVEIVDHPDMAALKRSKGVPEKLASCHTALVGGYVVEGHVPFDAIEKLLAAKPPEVAGIAVPGMPRGSPGMEMPDGSRDPFDVIAFTRNGSAKRFS